MSFEGQKAESMPGEKANSHPVANTLIDTATKGLEKIKESFGFAQNENLLEDKDRYTTRDTGKSISDTIGATVDST